MLPLQDHRTYSSSVSPRPSLSFTENALLQTTVRREESISGFFAGAALTLTKTIVKYPLDTATVRLQMPNNTEYSIRNLNRLFANAYVGVEAPLVANVPAGAVFFAVKDAVQSALANPNSNHHQYTISNSFSKTLISVAIAQIPYWILRNPTEVVKTRQQAGQANYYNYNYNSLAAPVAAAAAENGSNTTRRGSSTGGTGGNWKDIAQAYQQVRIDALRQQQQRYMSNSTATVASSYLDGWDAYYTGYWENILYAYPADVIKFQCYEWLSRGGSSNINSQKPKRLSPATGALYGAIATAVAQCVTTPLDVVRNRVMMTPATAAAAPVSYMESLVRLAREEGLAGLFAGVTPRVGKAILSGAIQFATYEETKQEFAKFFLQKKDS